MTAPNRIQTDFLAGAGEMGERIRSFDWSHTPLGAIEWWPGVLKTTVSLILSSRHPMWIGWGRQMTFLYNDAYLHVLGPAKHPWALGLPASEVWAEIWDICGPLADKVFQSGEASFVDDVRLFMYRGHFIEETFYSFSYSPIRDDSGAVCGLFCPSNDVTPKVVNARRLATLSGLAANALTDKTVWEACSTAARTLAKNPADVPFALLYLADVENRRALLCERVGSFDPVFVPAAAVDLDPATSFDWPIAEVFQTGSRQKVSVAGIAGLPTGFAGHPVQEAVVLPVAAGGQQRPYGVLVAGVNPCRPLDAEHLTFFELVASQVGTAIQNAEALEQEKRRADALAEVDRAKTVFFSNVSHEFRTPLTLILGPLEELLAQPESVRPEALRELSIAHRNSLRLLKLVNSLLDFSRLEAGRLNAAYEPTDLTVLTTDLASNFRSAMETAGLQLAVDCEPLPDPVYVDPEMWEKVVLNLLSNAFKFTLEGRVEVALRADEGCAVLTVSDSGIGISAEDLPRIFERFYRVEGARGRTYEGAGIGLALIKEYVKLHGGSISAISRLGEGTTFTVRIPFGHAHLPTEQVHSAGGAVRANTARAGVFTEEALTWMAEEAADKTGSAAAAAARPRILLADDNADMREHVAHILGEDFEVVTARDGREALEEVRRNPPDLLLSDVMMPGMDGVELLRQVRADERTATVPVIFLSARAGEEVRVEGLLAGADDYLVKPFTASELRARVATNVKMALARRRSAEQERSLRSEAEAARDQAVSILESITEGFVALDDNWRITYVNGEGERMNQARREDMVGQELWKLHPAAVGTTVQRELSRAAQERIPVEFENYYAPWRQWFHIKAFPRSGGGLSVFYTDITQQKSADDALRGSEDRYRAVVDTTPECVKVVAADGALLQMNPAGLVMVEAARAEEVIGKSVFDLIAPEFRKAYRAFHESICRGARGSLEYEIIGLNGRRLHMETHAVPLRQADGTVAQLSITRDVTERKQKDEELRASETRFRQLADSMPQIVWTAGPDGTPDYYNERCYAFTGFVRGGEDWETLLHPEDVQRTMGGWRAAIEAGQAYAMECRLWDRRENRWRWFMPRAVPTRDENGRIVKWFGTTTDIDEQKRAEEELKRANQDLEQFAYSASHDLQEPLRTINIYGELLASRYKEKLDGEALEFLDFLQSASSRMTSLVSDLRTYTQVAKLDVPEEVTDAQAVLERVVSDLAGGISESGASVTYDRLPSVRMHHTHLTQLFQNLIGNAIKYRSPSRPPTIHVSCRQDKGNAVFSVSDNGIGIHPEYTEQVFGLFKRLHTTDKYDGTGIGLAICQRIVERYQGRIWVESEPGKGSTFRFQVAL